MALTATDWTIDRATGDIRYTGGDHDSSPTYATVIQFHRWVQDLADDAVAIPASGDELDITNINPTARSTDNIITLLGSYNIDANASEHLYDGSIIQESGDTIYDGIVNFGVATVQIQIMQDGAVLSDDWWNYGGAGLNANSAQGISHRFMLKTRADGVDIDGRRLLGTSRTFGNTYSEFPINGTSRGNNVLALTESNDLNNETAAGTVSGWTGVTNTEGLRLIDVNNDSTDEEYYSEWNTNQPTRSINDFFERLKWLSRDGSASTLNGLNGELFRGITTSFGYDGEAGGISISTNDMLAWGTAIVYSGESGGPFTVGESIHEDTATPSWKGRILAVDDDGSTGTLIVDVESGTVLTTETFTGQSSAAGATVNGTPTAVADGGVLHVMADDTTDDILYVQTLKGIAPADNDILYYVGTDLATADATDYLDVANEVATITTRTISTPFVGVSTGSAIIGSYGLGIEAADLTSADKVFDLTNTQITPPNNVTNTVAGLVSGEDRVIVAPRSGVDGEGNPAIEKDQLSLNAGLTTDNITAFVTTEAPPHGTPSTGYMRLTDNNGFERRLHFTSWAGSGPTTYQTDTTDGNEDFNSVNADATNDMYIAYLDELASGTTASWTAVHSTGTDDLVVVVRDGDSTPIKEFISAWTFASASATITAIRTTDA